MKLARMKRTFIAGIFTLIPVVVIALLLAKVFEVIAEIVAPLEHLIPFSGWIEAILLKVIAALLVVIVIYLTGFIAERQFVAVRLKKLDRLLNRVVPGYTMVKGVISGAVDPASEADQLSPVLVRAGGVTRIGLEVERAPGGQVVVFLPNAPATQTGISVVVEPDDVERLDIAPHEALEMLEFFGRGMAGMAAAGRMEQGIASH